jgi:iron complex outermembrane receptor protein
VDLLELLNVEVSTATKTAQSIADAPAIITVITAADISRYGYQSVGEALEHVLGFYFVDDHILPNVGVRGVPGGLFAESGVIKVMIDGASVAYRSTSGNWLGVELIPLSSVQQIEVIRGPASALYGADAFLGVVNVITLPPDDIPLVSARGHASLVGDHPGGQFDVAGGKRFGDVDLLLGAAGELKDRSGLALPAESPAPLLPSHADPEGRSRGLERQSLVLHGRLGYRRPGGQVVVQALASGIERGGDFAHWAQLTAGRDAQGREAGTRIRLGQYRVTVSGVLAASPQLSLSMQGTYFQGGVLDGDRIEVASDLFWLRRRVGYRGLEANLDVRWSPARDVDLIVGVETVLDHEWLPAPERISKDTGEVLGDAIGQPSVTLSNLGAYVSANWRLDPMLKLTSGLRVDGHSIYGGQATGRLGVTSQWSSFLVTKLLYGSAFKAPSPYLLYAVPLRAGDLIGERDLEPQRIDTVEAQALIDLGKNVDVASGVAYSVIRDKAEFAPEGLNQTARNLANQTSLSWETRIDARIGELITSYAAFEWIHSTRDLGREGYAAQVVGDGNVAYPDWMVRAGLTLDLPLHPELPLQLGSQAIIVGPTPAADASIVERGQRFDLPGRAWLNASVATPSLFLVPGQETTFALRGKNLLGQTGPSPGFSGFEYPLAPREVMLEIMHRY